MWVIEVDTVLENGTTSAIVDFNYCMVGMLRVLGKLGRYLLSIFQRGRPCMLFE